MLANYISFDTRITPDIVRFCVGKLKPHKDGRKYGSNHSTILCIVIYMETINHYVNEGSNVYCCLLEILGETIQAF